MLRARRILSLPGTWVDLDDRKRPKSVSETGRLGKSEGWCESSARYWERSGVVGDDRRKPREWRGLS